MGCLRCEEARSARFSHDVKRPSDREDARPCSPAAAATPPTGTFPDSSTPFFSRSDRAPPEIVSIDAKPARARKGVHLVPHRRYYAASGWEVPPGRPSPTRRGGTEAEEALLAGARARKVHYVGQPSRYSSPIPRARPDLGRHRARYRDLPAAVGFEARRLPPPRSCMRTSPGTAFEYESGGERAAVGAAFAGAALKVPAHGAQPASRRQPDRAGAPSRERRAASGVFTVYSPSQGMNNMRDFFRVGDRLADGKDPRRHRAGGAEASAPQLLLRGACGSDARAQSFGRPVKWVATRSEVFLPTTTGAGSR